jgi:hypothetical protein
MSALSTPVAKKEKTVILENPTIARYHDNHEKKFNVIHRRDFKGGSIEDVLFVYEHFHEIIPGSYLHRKSQRIYKVICLVISPDTSEIYVLYQALYYKPGLGDKCIWVRELDNFNERVTNQFSSNKPRYEYCGP